MSAPEVIGGNGAQPAQHRDRAGASPGRREFRKATFMYLRVRKVAFLPCEGMKVAFLNPGFMKVAFLNPG